MVRTTTAIAVVAGVVAADQAAAAAFQLREGSAIAIGSALAGRTANDSDVSLAIQNPAVLRGVQGFQVSAGLAGIFPSSDATADGFVLDPTSPTAPTFPFTARRSTDNPNEAAVVPSFAMGYRLTEELVVGFTMKSPFGLATEYASDFATAYDGTRSELVTLSATPMVSWEMTPGFALGGGVTLQYADAELRNNFTALGLGPGDVSIKGRGLDSSDSYQIGYTLGLFIQAAPDFRIGASWQSGFEHSLAGDFSTPYLIPDGMGGAINLSGQAGTASFDLPPIVSVGAIFDATEDLRLMAEFEWTNWSTFDAIRISNDSGTFNQVDEQNYDDSYMMSVGVEYDVSDDFTVRGGLAFDTTPTVDENRSQRTPDSDRYWAAVGGSYQITERIGLDAAYLLIVAEEADIANEGTAVPGSRVTVDNGIVHLLQVNLSYTF